MDLRTELSLKFARKYHERSFERYTNLSYTLQKLLDQGQIVVATESPKSGGIFNFISCSEAKESVGCYLWTFDSEFWKWSEFTLFIEREKERLCDQIQEKREEIQELKDNVIEINKLTN